MIRNANTIKISFSRLLLAWYRRHHRLLPWRETSDPYRIWISEIMLQQTQVDTVIPYYHRFLKIFPDVHTLAAAPLQDVLKAWENLGYYSRARNISATARMVVENFGGRIPDTMEEIKTLPGIGEYTAGAILSIAYGQDVPAIDGNVRRILSRVFAIRRPAGDPGEQRKFTKLAASLVPAKHPGDFNQALMDLGATLCKANNPDCASCPIISICRAHLLDLQNILPVARKVPAIPHRQAAAAVIRNADDSLLIVQRPSAGLLASLWKLPGCFVEKTENLEKSLRQGVKKEVGVSIRTGKKLTSVNHTYTHFRTTLHVYESILLRGTPKVIACQDWRWATPADLKNLPMSKIDRMVIALIASLPK